MANIDIKLEAWKNKLLDLGKRNKLINYKDNKRSTLRIITPDAFDLWDSFVINENPLEFPYVADEQISYDTDEADVLLSSVTTNQSVKEQQRTLKSLRDKAKIAMEEQGVNILYLSFGFLRWSEAINSEQYFNSPLILVPVSLTIESISDPYILSLHEDEIIVNPTLSYKLENDYGIILQEFDNEQNISEYFETIRGMISKNKWEVLEDVGLSLLSFLKINMYNDLNKHKDKIKGHPVVRALCGDGSGLEFNLEDLNDFDHDKKTNPMDLFQVVDADSSQQDAVVCAGKGLSFVLQGPPGTGKSQTITNIIAESVADGKKVLFVSEKMAALEVVRRRLSNAGLGDFCLTLHSNKANKKEVLDQLGTVLNLTQKKASLSDEVYQKLDLLQEDKEKLNDYAEAIYKKVMPLEKTIYQVNGYLAHLQDYEDIIFPIPDVAKTTPAKFNRYINLLNQFNDTVGKMSDDYKISPWVSANIPNVTNELRHDVGANINKLIPKVISASKLYDEIEETLEISLTPSYNGMSELIILLKLASRSPKVPMHWILGEDVAPLYLEIDEYSNLKNQFVTIKNEISSQYTQIFNNDNSAPPDSSGNLLTSTQINESISEWNRFINLNNCYSLWIKTGNYNKAVALYELAKHKITEYNRLKAEILSVFEKEIFEIDFKGIQSRFKTDYTSFFKIFKKQYKLDKNQIVGKYREYSEKVDDLSIIATLSKLRQIDDLKSWMIENKKDLYNYFGEQYKDENTIFSDIEKSINAFEGTQHILHSLMRLKAMALSIEDKSNELKAHYDYLYKGFDTDWNSVAISLNWASEFRKVINKYNLNIKFIEQICTNQVIINKCFELAARIETTLKNIDNELSWYLSLFDDKDTIKNTKMIALYNRLEKCVNGLSLLEEWIDFRTARENCKKEGLYDFIDKIAEIQLNTSLVVNIFRKRFYRLWLDAILPDYPSVMNFRRRSHEGIINEFSVLDKLQLDIAKARIQKKLIDNLPSLDRFTNGVDEISILKRELGKSRRIMPLRKFFMAIPNLLLTLKPCLMMSPLSVSLFLETESYNFDVVIFDEASQVCTENAIGAISRGKQVIIAGDSKQLPPTNFFSASTSDSEYDNNDDENDDVNAYESILDEAALLPERTLLWHYRSKHEHLIAFSNSKIYKNSLVTFPSNVDKVSDNGVEYIYVKDGYYDRGGKKGNVIEAQKVAVMVFEHFKKYPNRSLGIIAFGEVQQQAIDAAIRLLRLKDQSYERFFNEDLVEAFFVKNLENVQGDERDTIIFSIGYAKPQQGGQMQMLFGPLSKSGGERRLNVAITRAKYNIKLVGSIMPTDIDLNRVSTEGPKLLRAYIDFAINGPVSILKEITESDAIEHDSPFEEAVYNFLDRKGYKLGTQVGCSGYRIDMAVKHPIISGKYVLGIECDGAAYHSARTARERDRLRQSVLEDMGWKIYRIWSTDWIKDPITEGEKLLDAVDNAISEFIEESLDNYEAIQPDTSSNFLQIDKKVKSPEAESNPYGFEEMMPTIFNNLPKNTNGFVNLSDCIMVVVNNEYPVHYDLLCKRLAFLFGNEKATVKVRNEVDYHMGKLGKMIIRKGDFLFPANFKTITPKCSNTRSINYVSTDELSEAMLYIARVCIGPTFDSLCLETARAYGYNRNTPKITAGMQAAYSHLLSNGKIKVIDGKVIVESVVSSSV